jgi:hypothetical protein
MGLELKISSDHRLLEVVDGERSLYQIEMTSREEAISNLSLYIPVQVGEETAYIQKEALKNRFSVSKEMDTRISNLFSESLGHPYTSSADVLSIVNTYIQEKSKIIDRIKKTHYVHELRSASAAIKSDKEVFLEAMKYSPNALEFASPAIRSDKTIIMESVKCFGISLQYASEDLKADEEVIHAAIAQSGFAIRFAPPSYRENRTFVLEAVKTTGQSLQLATLELKTDPEIVLAAVQQDGNALQFADDSLKGNKEIVMEAVKQNGKALIYASPLLKGDQDLLLTAIKSYHHILGDCSTDQKKDQFFLLEAFKINPSSISYFHDSVFENRSFLEELFLINPAMTQEYFDSHHIPAETQKLILETCLSREIEPKLQELIEEASSVAKECLIELKPLLFESIINFGQSAMKAKLFSALLNASTNEHFKTLLLDMKDFSNNRISQASFLPILSLSSLQLTEDQIKKYASCFHQKNKLLKDGPTLQKVLLFLQTLSELTPPLPNEKIEEILDQAIDIDLKDGKIETLELLTGFITFDSKAISSLRDFTSDHLKGALIEKISSTGLIDSSITEIQEKFTTTFLSSKDPAAIFVYTALQQKNSDMKTAIKTFIKCTLNGTIQSYRNSHNSHASKLTGAQKAIWETSSSKEIEIGKSKEVLRIEIIEEFLRDKLEIQNHGTEFIRTTFLTLPDGDLTESERLTKSLLDPTLTKEARIETIDQISRLLPGRCKFRNDLKKLKNLVIGSKIKTVDLVDSDNVFDLFLCGNTAKSCLRTEGDPEITKCLMGYCLDGKIRLLAIKDKDGKILARSIFKLLLDKDEKPVLFLERIYPKEDPEIREIFKEYAKEKADLMGIKAYETGHDVRIHSIGNTAPYEYEDGTETIEEGVSDGVYTIKANEIIF